MENTNYLADKLILVFYINIGNIAQSEVDSYMKNTINSMAGEEDKNLIKYFVPIRNGDSKVECIPNPFVK